MLWNCPCLEEARTEGDPDFGGFDVKSLPAPLQIGLPPAMTANITDCFWDFIEGDLTSNPPSWAKVPGRCYPGRRAEVLLNDRSLQEKALNARQLVNKLRAGDTGDMNFETARCFDVPPMEPNVYTDGAFKHPQTQRWGIGGFGVWWPDRDFSSFPPTMIEQNFSAWKHEVEGMSFWGAL